jgi:hypothetical protein
VILRVGVHPRNLAHRLAVETGEQFGRRPGIVHVGGRHQDAQQQSHAVDHDVALPAVDVLGVVATPLFAAGGGVDRLAVDARGGAGMVGLLRRADFTAERVVDRVQRAVVPPLIEVSPDGALGREILGEVAPLAAGAKDVEDGVNDVPRVSLAGSASGVNRDMRLDQAPLLVGDVAGVVV